MTLETELLILAWDNYKKVIDQSDGYMTKTELIIDSAMYKFVDEHQTGRRVLRGNHTSQCKCVSCL